MILALRLLPYAVSGILVAALWFLWSDRADKLAEISSLQRELAVQAMVVAQKDEARRVADAEALRYRSAAKEYDDLKETLLRGDNDAPLPDWFRAYLASLFARD